MRGEAAGRFGRALTISTLGMLLVGVALGMTSGDAVNGLPAGWGGAPGLAGARLVEHLVSLIGNPGIEQPVRWAVMAMLALGGLVLAYVALALRPEEKGWFAGLFDRGERPVVVKPPRRTRIAEDDEEAPAAPPRSRPAVAVAEGFGRMTAILLRNTNPVHFFDLGAISLPLPRQNGLSTGLMLVGRNGQDRRLFDIAAAVEKALKG